MYVIIDIETGPLSPEKREHTRPTWETMKWGNAKKEETRQKKFEEAVEIWEAGDKAALDALTGEIIMIGFSDTGYEYMDSGLGEGLMLSEFWTRFGSPIRFVGHNILNFDIPFLLKRSYLNGIKPPEWIINDIRQYHSEFMFDTMRFWQFGNKQNFTSLTALCGAFGISVKESEVSGADFHKWWASDPEAAIDYNRQDVEAVAKLYPKLR